MLQIAKSKLVWHSPELR